MHTSTSSTNTPDYRSGEFTNIFIDSATRIDPSEPPSSCTVKIDPPLNLGTHDSITLTNFNYTPGIGNLNDLYNTLYIEDSVLGVRQIVMPTAFYTIATGSFSTFSLILDLQINLAFGAVFLYNVTFSSITQKITITNTSGNTFRFLWATAPVAKSQLISTALGYGAPFNLPDTPFAVSHTPPGPVNIAYPTHYRIVIENLSHGAVRTTNGQPATFILASTSFPRNINFFNNSLSAALIKTGEYSGLSTISELRIRIESALSYPLFPLEEGRNNWTMVLTVHRKAC